MINKTRKKKTALLLIIALMYILALFLTLAFLINSKYKAEKFSQKEWVLFRVEDIQDPEQILWFEENLFIKKDIVVKKLVLESRALSDFKKIEQNNNLSIYNDELVFLSYENFEIFHPDEIATEVKIFNKEMELLFSKTFNETLMPIFIEDNFLILIDNYFNSPERTYRVNLGGGELELFNLNENFKIEGEENIQIMGVDGEVLVEIPKKNDIRSFSANENFEKLAFVDTQGDLWIYFLKNPDY